MIEPRFHEARTFVGWGQCERIDRHSDVKDSENIDINNPYSVYFFLGRQTLDHIVTLLNDHRFKKIIDYELWKLCYHTIYKTTKAYVIRPNRLAGMKHSEDSPNMLVEQKKGQQNIEPSMQKHHINDKTAFL